MRKAERVYSVKKTDWEAFGRKLATAVQERLSAEAGSVESAASRLSELIVSSFRSCTLCGRRRGAKAWWTPECTRAHDELVRAASEAQRNPGPDSSEAYGEARRQADRVYAAERERTWRGFVEGELSGNVVTSRMWAVMRGMEGRGRKPLPDKPIIDDRGRPRVSDKEKANLAVDAYVETSWVMVDRLAVRGGLHGVARAD